MAAPDKMEKIVSLCKRRGYVFPASEIYGGQASCWDYGPLGVELKRNVKQAWWNSMVQQRQDVVGLDSAILQHPQVWQASGHVAGFSDPLVDCRECKARFREDHVEESVCGNKGFGGRKASKCREAGLFTEARQFNLMFKTHMGPVEDTAAVAYLRPETAQGIFINFANVLNSSRQKPPFGIAQIGKSFRNEITPGNFIFRTREFEQMEMEFFVPPDQWQQWYEYWRDARHQWYVDLGVQRSHLRIRPHAEDELAHYANACVDVEYEFPFGWSELEGIASRTDFDLKQHSEHSGKDLQYFDDVTKSHYHPYVFEPAAGVDRATLAFLVDSYEEQQLEKELRTVLHLHPRLAPIKVAVFPLVKRDGMPERAHQVEADLRKHFQVFYDESGAVGRRYRRQDEVGTPFCVTIDGETAENNSVTLRDRDSMLQERVNLDALAGLLREKLG